MAEVQPEGQLAKSLKNIYRPGVRSHKGQNGRLLIIGGSKIFHAASLWSAEIASHFVDLVHYSSTVENEAVFINLKTKFVNGIVIPQVRLFDYVEEDEVILIGPGMERGADEEADYTKNIIKTLIEKYPHKQYVFDAAALQMMSAEWLKDLQKKAIVTPHTKEFRKLFGQELNSNNKKELLLSKAREFNCIILLKDVEDYVCDGTTITEIIGGNEGLVKGGSGDVLAGLTASFATKSPAIDSAIMASYIEKTAAEALYPGSGPYFNTSDLINKIPSIAKKVLFDND